MPGYNLAASDRESIDRKYLCNSCGLLLQEAIRTACGHFYCRSCLGNLLINGSFKMTCLQDDVELNENEVFPDNYMRLEVLPFIVYCTFKDEGCQWKGEVRHLEAHVNSCEFVKISCVYPECGMLVKKPDLCQHLETECKCRHETCGFCKKQISLNKMKRHQEIECPAYPEVCEKCNKDGIPRAKLAYHQDPVIGDCNAVQGPCSFAQVGCCKTELHCNSCDFVKVRCVYTDCNVVVKKADLAWHLINDHSLNLTDRQISVDCEALGGPCPFSQIGCPKTEILNEREKREHLTQEIVRHNVLVLQFALGISKDLEAIVRRDPRVMSRSPQMFTHYDSVVQDLLRRMQNNLETTRNLQEKLREHSERITLLERKMAAMDVSGAAAVCATRPADDDGSLTNLDVTRRISDAEGSLPNMDILRRITNLENKTADHEVRLVESTRTIVETSREVGMVRRQVDKVNRKAELNARNGQRWMQSIERERKMAAVNVSGAAAASATRPFDAEGSLPNMDILRRITNLENKTADHEVLLVESNRTVVETSREVGMVKRQVGKMNRKAGLNVRNGVRWMQSIEHELTLRSVTLADLEEYVRQQEFSSYDGQLLWKITEFSRRKNEAVSGQKVSFYSPCFFTSRYGYKMCVCIFLNGDGAGRGTHISVVFCVLPGQYDTSLRWPFRQKVTVMLLDQDFESHITASFIPDPDSDFFQRCPMFCSLEELNRHAYVRNDVMFLKVIVDTTGL